jgi:hypothetical protein
MKQLWLLVEEADYETYVTEYDDEASARTAFEIRKHYASERAGRTIYLCSVMKRTTSTEASVEHGVDQ